MPDSKPMAQAILSPAALRDIEHAHRQAEPPLMERAGQAAAQLALRILACRPRLLAPLVIAGPGNNGGDAFVVARLLREAGFAPVLVFIGQPAQLPADARRAYEQWLAAGGSTLSSLPRNESAYALIVDGLFGIGLARELSDDCVALVKQINGFDCPVLALDIPSGLDAATGRVLGAAVRASHTISFIALKAGLLTLDGPDHCGEISVHNLGLGSSITHAADCGWTLTPALFAHALQPRTYNSHKGSYGSIGILGGATGMTGAALLAGRAALKLGGGRVYLGMLEHLTVDPQQPELMLRAPDALFEQVDCLAIGPGLGQSGKALSLVIRAIDSKLPLLLDADALNLCAAHSNLLDKLAQRPAPTVLTPHPAEAARLLQSDPAHIQADRLAAARQLARRCNAIVVLKGCGSIISLPNGPWYINTSGNPGLATAGSGDVLTGMCLALLGQGWPAATALSAAVHLHGCAADACVAEGKGPIGLSAGELIVQARSLLNRWVLAASGNAGLTTSSLREATPTGNRRWRRC